MSCKLGRISFVQFRNLEEKIIEFSSHINCIYGNNGNGKTNLLEAIYFLSHKKSFRKATKFTQILSVDSESPEFTISAALTDEDLQLQSFSCRISESQSEWFVNGRPAKKKPNLFSIFVSPFDSYNFYNSAAFRRSWVDQQMSQLDPDYKKALARYNLEIRQRNKLLSTHQKNVIDQIKAIDDSLVQNVYLITAKRKLFSQEIGNFAPEIFQQIFSSEHNIELRYQAKFLNLDKENIAKKFHENLEKDLIVGHSLNGPHKDDFCLFFDGFLATEYCSLGQQKMSYLSLLFAYIELFRYKFGLFPIVLIDDVSGELDRSRWENLVKFLESRMFQVFITTANENFKAELDKISNSKRFTVDQGVIEVLA